MIDSMGHHSSASWSQLHRLNLQMASPMQKGSAHILDILAWFFLQWEEEVTHWEWRPFRMSILSKHFKHSTCMISKAAVTIIRMDRYNLIICQCFRNLLIAVFTTAAQTPCLVNANNYQALIPPHWHRLHSFLRLSPGSSLFDTVPSHLSTISPRKYCNCQTEPRHVSSSTLSHPVTSAHSSCSQHANVHLPAVIPTLDITAEYIGSVEPLRGDENDTQFLPPGHPSQNIQNRGRNTQPHERIFPSRVNRANEDGASASAQQKRRRSRRRTHQYVSNSQHQSLSQSDLEGFTDFFPEDHEEAVQPDASPSWPTPSGLTEQQARTQCQQAVANSSIALGCSRLLEESIVNHAVAMCVTDLQLKDEPSWMNATLPLLENECERRLIEERRREEEYQDVLAVLKCPNLCNWNGQCSEWGCVCFPGFGSYDCSMLSGKTRWDVSLVMSYCVMEFQL